MKIENWIYSNKLRILIVVNSWSTSWYNHLVIIALYPSNDRLFLGGYRWIFKIHSPKFRNHQRLTKFFDYCYCLTTIDRVIRQQVIRSLASLFVYIRQTRHSKLLNSEKLVIRATNYNKRLETWRRLFFAHVITSRFFDFFSKKKRVLDALPNVARIQVYISNILCRTRESIFSTSTSTRLSVKNVTRYLRCTVRSRRRKTFSIWQGTRVNSNSI